MLKYKVYKYKPFTKTVTKLSPDGSKAEEKEVIVKDAYIVVKENGDSFVNSRAKLEQEGIIIPQECTEYLANSTNSNIIRDEDEEDEPTVDKKATLSLKDMDKINNK